MRNTNHSIRTLLATTLVMIIAGALLVTAASATIGLANVTQPQQVWVNAAWAGSVYGEAVGGHTFGVDATDTIQNGSNLVADGGTVYVAAGTYVENVVIDHPLVLRGANAGVPASGARGAESIVNGSIVNGSNVEVSIVNGSSGTGISVTSSGVTVDGFEIQGFTDPVVFTGDDVQIINNVVDGSTASVFLSGTGDDAVIANNLVDFGYGESVFVLSGDNGVVTGNTVNGAQLGNDVIRYEGMGNNINNNTINVDYVHDNVIEYEDASLYSSSVETQQITTKGGTIADNTLDASYVGSVFIHYYGDAGKVLRNKDLSANEYMWPMVEYEAAVFGHGVITDNVGGAILYTNSDIMLAPYGTITGNHVNASILGIEAAGDYNVVSGNEINATIGTYTMGTNVTVDSNAFNAIPYVVSVKGNPIPLSAGAIFYGDQCSVTDNTFNNVSIGVANIGLFAVVSIDSAGAVKPEYTDVVNASLDDVSAEVSALGDLAKGYVEENHVSSISASSQDVSTLGLGTYRGYGNKISANTFNYDNYPGVVGIVNLGYDFVVDSNVFHCVNDSYLLAGIIVGGDGGKVTNNELGNVTLMGMYYGGLLKFDNGVYTTDLLGLNAQISGNTIDDRNEASLGELSPLGGLLPWGIIFTGYDAKIEDNQLLGLGLGVLSVQFQGSIADNTIDTYRDASADLIGDLSVGDASAESADAETISGLGGIISVCNNLTVTGNYVNGTLMGMLFVPIDPYTTWGTAHISGNTLSNNMFQLAFVPSYFEARLDNGTVSTLDNATLQNVMDQNSLDRKVYITDAAGEPWNINILDDSYFNVDAITVFGDLDAASLVACFVPDDFYTVHVSPATYPLFMPVLVIKDNLTYIGDPSTPGNVVVDASSLSLADSAFVVSANDVNITGFTITSETGEDCGIAVGPSESLLGARCIDENIIGKILDEILDVQVSNVRISNNTIENFQAGIYLDNSDYADIAYNNITGNGMGIYLSNRSLSNSTQIHYNDIAGNSYFGVNYNNTAAVPDPEEDLWVHAEHNWWGSDSGPFNVTDPMSDGTGDSVTYYVLYEPVLTKSALSSVYTYHLVQGWNLIGVPVDASDKTITGFFPSNVLSNIEVVWGWNESGQTWVLHSADSNDPFYSAPYNYKHLDSIKPGHAYWVYSDVNTSFEVAGSIPSSVPASPDSLVNGWNFVSITGLSPQDVTLMYPNTEVVWGWNESGQTWVLHSADSNDPFYSAPYNYKHLTQVQPGHGYWVYKGSV